MQVLVGADTVENAVRMRNFLATLPNVECILPRDPASGTSFISVLSHVQPDLLILDEEMHTVGALTVLEHLRQKGLSTRAVLLSSAVTSSLCEKARDLEVERILPKPFEPDELADILTPKPLIADASQCDSFAALRALLREAGLPPKAYGTTFLQEAIREVTNRPELVHRMTTELYPLIARCFGSSPSRVERCMRSAIEISWRRGEPLLLYTVFGHCNDSRHGRPCNSEYIAAFSQYFTLLRREFRAHWAENQE